MKILLLNEFFVQFIRHLRKDHCSREGGSFVCLYGYNGVCTSLPVEGVSDKDYEDHVVKHHIKIMDFKDIGLFFIWFYFIEGSLF